METRREGEDSGNWNNGGSAGPRYINWNNAATNSNNNIGSRFRSDDPLINATPFNPDTWTKSPVGGQPHPSRLGEHAPG